MGLIGIPEKRSLPNAKLRAATKFPGLIAHAESTPAKASTICADLVT
jgi:hypothetical protein